MRDRGSRFEQRGGPGLYAAIAIGLGVLFPACGGGASATAVSGDAARSGTGSSGGIDDSGGSGSEPSSGTGTGSGATGDDASGDDASGDDSNSVGDTPDAQTVGDDGGSETGASLEAGSGSPSGSGASAGASSGTGGSGVGASGAASGGSSGSSGASGATSGSSSGSSGASGAASGSSSGASSGSSGGCKPTVSAVAPPSGGTVDVVTSNSSTWLYDFQANVTFCHPMQTVQFDYQGPNGICLQQRQVFTTLANPFSENTQAGGGVGSLATCGNGSKSQSWTFIVSATDSASQTTTLSVPFTLNVSNH